MIGQQQAAVLRERTSKSGPCHAVYACVRKGRAGVVDAHLGQLVVIGCVVVIATTSQCWVMPARRIALGEMAVRTALAQADGESLRSFYRSAGALDDRIGRWNRRRALSGAARSKRDQAIGRRWIPYGCIEHHAWRRHVRGGARGARGGRHRCHPAFKATSGACPRISRTSPEAPAAAWQDMDGVLVAQVAMPWRIPVALTAEACVDELTLHDAVRRQPNRSCCHTGLMWKTDRGSFSMRK